MDFSPQPPRGSQLEVMIIFLLLNKFNSLNLFQLAPPWGLGGKSP